MTSKVMPSLMQVEEFKGNGGSRRSVFLDVKPTLDKRKSGNRVFQGMYSGARDTMSMDNMKV